MSGRWKYVIDQNPWLANVGKAMAETHGDVAEDKQFYRTLAWMTGIKLMPHHKGEAMRRAYIERKFEERERKRQIRRRGRPLE